MLHSSLPFFPYPVVLVTVLNVIIDIYADEDREYDRPVFVEGQILEGLMGLVGRVRTQVSDVGRLGSLD